MKWGAGVRSIGQAAESALKRRQWHWSRRENGFSAKAKWKVVAARLGMPAYQVIALVNRLEELANEGEVRGSVEKFNADEAAVELGMTSEEAARIYAALEHPDIGWIDQDHIVDFYDRNPDREDPTANLRDRRRRTRQHVLKQLSVLAREGRIDAGRRTEIEASLKLLPDSELFDLPAALAREALSTGNREPRRENVRPTPEQSTAVSERPVENPGADAATRVTGLSEQQVGAIAANVAAAGTDGEAEEAQEELWLKTEGKRLIVETLVVVPGRADTLVERWLSQIGGSATALANVLRSAAVRNLKPAQFHVIVADSIRRHCDHAENGPVLPMGPAGKRKPAPAPTLAAAPEQTALRKAAGDG